MARSVRARPLHIIPFITFLGIASATPVAARSVYLNGIDISNAQNQEVIGATVQINEKGDIFILAPHYQVNEEDTYLPLSSAKAALNSTPPKHQKPQELNGKVDEEKSSPADDFQDAAPMAAPGKHSAMDGELMPASAEIPVTARSTAPSTEATEAQAPVAAKAGLPPVAPAQMPTSAIPKDGQKTSN